MGENPEKFSVAELSKGSSMREKLWAISEALDNPRGVISAISAHPCPDVRHVVVVCFQGSIGHSAEDHGIAPVPCHT